MVKDQTQWAKMHETVTRLLGNQDKPDLVVWGAMDYEGGGAITGVLCLGRESVVCAGKTFLIGARSWRFDYKDIQNVGVDKGVAKKPKLVVSTPSARESVYLRPEDVDEVLATLKERIAKHRTQVAAKPATDVATRLSQLETLRKQGLITTEEYEAKRKAIISEI